MKPEFTCFNLFDNLDAIGSGGLKETMLVHRMGTIKGWFVYGTDVTNFSLAQKKLFGPALISSTAEGQSRETGNIGYTR
jgi:hypothetical protein